MSWWLPHKFAEKRGFLQKRMEIIKEIRRFFDDQGFWEVQTPVLQTCPSFDVHIHGFKTNLGDMHLNPLKDLYLQTSPELDMKKLMVAGVEKLYQICPVFRNGDGGTGLHAPEFTMLEWYRTGADYTALMEDCQTLLRGLNVKKFKYKGHAADPYADWTIISAAEAFQKYAGINLDDYLNDTEKFSAAISKSGIRIAPDDQWDDLFFRVMAEKIEPYLGMSAPTILKDYPLSMAALSRPKQDDPRYAERFELYVCGVELANAFSELTDAAEQRKRFEEDMKTKQKLYGVSYPADEEFFKALEHGMPPSTGIALGVDRLIMLATGAEDIKQVLWTSR